MAEVPGQASSLFNRLRLLRRVLPPVTFLAGIAYEIVEHGLLNQHVPPAAFVGELIFYAMVGPLLIFVALTWLMRRVAERDVAETRLKVLYDVSRQSGAARSLDELQQIALSVPQRAGLPSAATALIIRDGPGRPWLLAGTRGFSEGDVTCIQAGLARRQDQPDCVTPSDSERHLQADCPLLRALIADVAEPRRLAFCISLSHEAARRVMMAVYVPQGSVVPPDVAETLEPLAAGLALALDRASSRAHERQLLRQVQRNIVTEQTGLVPTFEHILADIAAEHPLAAAAVYLLSDEGPEQRLSCAAAWPNADACATLLEDAANLTALTGRMPGAPSGVGAAGSSLSAPYVLSLPIASEDQVLGVLVLASHSAVHLPHPSILDTVATMMALVIRNAQLFGRLESQAVLEERNHLAREVHDGVAQALAFYNFKVQQVQRLLSRGDVPGADAALQELRVGSQEVYDEVRRMILDLSGSREEGDDLAQSLQNYCRVFTGRTGLAVSLDLGPEIQLPPEIQGQLFRIVQEALNNAHRHAQAEHVCVTLRQSTVAVELSVRDDGAGLPPQNDAGEHFGLRIMRQRVQSIGGELRLISRPGEGTTVDVTVPAPTQGQRRKEEPWSALIS